MQKNSHKKDLKKKFLNWFKNFWPILVILLAVLVFFYPVWLKGLVPLPADIVVGSYYPWLDYKWGYPTGVPVKNPITSDAISFSFPMRMLAIDLLKSGQWPLWNPYILFGTPLLANFQSAPFSPTNFVYLLTDKLTGWTLQIMLQHVLAIVFTYLLLRNWGISKTSSIFGGIIFSFSGFSLIWSQWNAHTLTVAFVPLAILLVDRWGRFGNIWAVFGLSLVLALQIFSGYPQIVFYTLIAILLFWFIAFWGIQKFWRKTSLVLTSFLFGLGISAIQILPGYELISLSQRAREVIPLEWVFLSWEQIITFIAPDFFGNHATGNYWGPKNYTSVVGFVGVAALVFAIFSLPSKKREIKFLVLLVLISLTLAFPTPISLWLWQTNPLGIQAGVSLRALFLFTLAVSLMAAIGMDYLLSRPKTSLKIPILVPTAILLSFLFYAFLGIQEEWQQKVAIRNLILPFTSLVGVLIVLFVLVRRNVPKQFAVGGFFLILTTELFYFGWKFTPFVSRHIVYPETPVIEFLQNKEKPFRFNGADVVPANLFISYKIESISGYDAVYPLATAKFIGVINSNDAGAKPQDRYGIVTNKKIPVMNLLNAKYVLAKALEIDGINKEKYFEVFRDKGVVVLGDKEALPRAFVVHKWEVIPDKSEVLTVMLNENFLIDEKVIVEEEPDLLGMVDSLVGETPSNVEYKKYSEQESLLFVNTTQDGFLFVSETFYPGWKAFVDGVETKIYKANYAFRAVSVPAGEHEVRFVYKPDSFYNGIKLSSISFVALLLLPLFFKWRYKWIN